MWLPWSPRALAWRCGSTISFTGRRASSARWGWSVELVLAIRTVRAGQPYLQPYMASLLISSTLQPFKRAGQLTGREQQIYALLTCGLSNRQIAAELQISKKTASVHVSNLIGKLGLRNRTQVALYALQSAQ